MVEGAGEEKEKAEEDWEMQAKKNEVGIEEGDSKAGKDGVEFEFHDTAEKTVGGHYC